MRIADLRPLRRGFIAGVGLASFEGSLDTTNCPEPAEVLVRLADRVVDRVEHIQGRAVRQHPCLDLRVEQ